MKLRSITSLATALFLSVSVSVSAQEAPKVRDAWVKEAPPGAKVMAAYLVIENFTGRKQTLTGALSRAFDKVEIHKTEMRDGMAHMMPVAHLEIPVEKRVRFTPGGHHLMLIGPKQPLAAGDSAVITLLFEGGETVTVMAPVRKADGNGHGHSHGHSHGQMHEH